MTKELLPLFGEHLDRTISSKPSMDFPLSSVLNFTSKQPTLAVNPILKHAPEHLEAIAKAKANNVNMILACDAKIADKFSNDANTQLVDADQIPDGWQGLDIGPKTEAEYAEVIKKSKTILWNGPTGVFEFENFSHGSLAVGEAIVEATKNGAFSLVGGGDSVACVNKFGLANGVSYVSTGGGALLEAIEGKILPGIEAIRGY